ncbi:MAG TPA: pyrroline-5-carboxylate reductase, partial [Campylobacterales bacterium]|nr:pyrroline-5-carboxylate reductase [Campylobacterales bacterium]
MLSIVGTGKMAQAIIKGLKDRFEIEVVGRDLKKLKKLESKNISIKTFEDFSPNEKTIILAIKPNALNDISKYLNGSDTIISILAGVSLEILKNKINAKSYIRAMP